MLGRLERAQAIYLWVLSRSGIGAYLQTRELACDCPVNVDRRHKILGQRQKTFIVHSRAGNTSFMFVSVLLAAQVPRGQHGAAWMPAVGCRPLGIAELGGIRLSHSKPALFPQRETSPCPLKLLPANIPLGNGPGKEWSGPCILDSPSKMYRSGRAPGRSVSQKLNLRNTNQHTVNSVAFFCIKFAVSLYIHPSLGSFYNQLSHRGTIIFFYYRMKLRKPREML